MGELWDRIDEDEDALEGMLAMLELSFSWFEDPQAKGDMGQGIQMHAEGLLTGERLGVPRG